MWLAARPLILAAVFTAVFGRLMAGQGSAESYAGYLITGLVPWIFLDEGVRTGARTFLGYGPLMKSQRTDPVHLCAVSALEHTLVFAAAVLILWAGKVVLVRGPGPNDLLIAPLLGATFLLLWGLNLVLAVLVAFVRDLEPAIEPVFILLFWSAPVAYRPEILAPPLQRFLEVWPPAAWVRLWRAALGGREAAMAADFALVLAPAALLLAAGWQLARRRGRRITDLV